MTRALTYEKENEMFFLFLPCTARDLGLFQSCSRMFQGTKGTSGNTPVVPLFFHCAARDLGRLEQKEQQRPFACPFCSQSSVCFAERLGLVSPHVETCRWGAPIHTCLFQHSPLTAALTVANPQEARHG